MTQGHTLKFSFERGHLLRNGNKCLPFHLSDDLPRCPSLVDCNQATLVHTVQLEPPKVLKIGRRFAEACRRDASVCVRVPTPIQQVEK